MCSEVQVHVQSRSCALCARQVQDSGKRVITSNGRDHQLMDAELEKEGSEDMKMGDQKVAAWAD